MRKLSWSRAFLPIIPSIWLSIWAVPAALPRQRADEDIVEHYSRAAEQALAQKNLDAAVAALEELARLTPKVAEVHGNLGMVYYAQGRHALAARAFKSALGLNPGMRNAEVMLGVCLAQIGRYKEAIRILEPTFRRPPDKEIGRTIGLQLQRAYRASGRHGEALEVSEELLNRYPSDPEVLYHASHLYGDRALRITLRLVDVAPNSPWKRVAFGEIHEAQKRYDLAITEYRSAIEMDPRLPGVHFRLGRAILLNSKDNEAARDEAMRAFQQELAVDPENSDAEYEIGDIHRRRGLLERAQQHLSRALEYHPQFEEAQIALARTLIDLKRPREALPHLLAAAQSDQTNEVPHFLLAQVYRSLGQQSDYRNEMALFQKYHIRPYATDSGGSSDAPAAISAPEVTKQTLDSETKSQP